MTELFNKNFSNLPTSQPFTNFCSNMNAELNAEFESLSTTNHFERFCYGNEFKKTWLLIPRHKRPKKNLLKVKCVELR